MWAILVKEFRQLRRDRRTVGDAAHAAVPLPDHLRLRGQLRRQGDQDGGSRPYGRAGRRPPARAVRCRSATYPDEGEAFARDALRDGEAVVAIVTPSSAAGWRRLTGSAGLATRQARARILVDGSSSSPPAPR